MAIFAALDVAQLSTNVHLYTFGAPRAGDAVFVSYLHSHTDIVSTFRIVNSMVRFLSTLKMSGERARASGAFFFLFFCVCVCVTCVCVCVCVFTARETTVDVVSACEPFLT